MKNNKTLLSLLVFASCVVAGCHSGSGTPKEVFVTFLDYDDSILYHGKIPYGSVAVYPDEELPKGYKTMDKVYTFDGWDKNIEDKLYKNTVFKAQFRSSARKYVTTFKNYDGTILQELNLEYGEPIRYTGATPTKQSDDRHYEYVFSGWTGDIFHNENVDGHIVPRDIELTAEYSTNEYVFATFYDFDGTFLWEDKVLKGGNAEYQGKTPIRTYTDNTKGYRFAGWDKSLNNLYADTVFTPNFDLVNYYTVTFKNYDGSVLQTVRVLEGDDAVYTGSTPYRSSTKSGDYEYHYSFSGWSGSITNVMSDLTVTAVYNTSTWVTGATAIRNHLDYNGTGNYNNVETYRASSAVCTLGYSGSDFYMAYTDTSSMESYMAVSCTYGASSGMGSYQLYNYGVLMFAATYYVYFSNHMYDSISLRTLTTTRYTTDAELAAVAALTVIAARFAVNKANEYLDNNGLPYVF